MTLETALEGKKAFVTGASRGIGAAIARRLATEGAAVAVGYERSVDAAQTIVEEINANGGHAVAVQMDARNAASVRHAVDRVAELLGGLDILVSNAGIMRGGTIDDMTLDDIDAVLEVNVRAVIIASQAALAYLPEGGRIITIGSNLATRSLSPGVSLYSASKAAIEGWTKGLARDLGPRKITVNAVHPGSTDTDMNPLGGPLTNRQLERMAIPRYAEPEEIAALVAFVAGPEAASINGAGLLIDGGANA